MKRIIPFFWFENQAEEAARFYAGLFKSSSVGSITRYSKSASEASGIPEGTVMSAEFKLCGQDFVALNGGPHLKFSPAVSMTVFCETEAEIDSLWSALTAGGQVLMGLGKYPFSEKFGFLQDRYGVSWQLNLVRQKQRIVPSLLFVESSMGQAEAAMKTYAELFKDARVLMAQHYGEGEVAPKGALKYGHFSLGGYEFIAMDGAGKHDFTFTGGISFMIECEGQAELDHFWNAFAKGGQELPCGWIVDRFGITWQVVPSNLQDLIGGSDPVKAERAMGAMMQMKKLDIRTLERARDGV
jgi:predicted 3-demethylubiquinone-9 3-methyltransferase (glyoxalase superfamily)